MKRSILICIAITLLFISITSWAQNKIDIKGWNNTKWGMTEKNLRHLFKGQITDTGDKDIYDEKFYRSLKLTKYNIDSVDFEVLFEMGIMDNKLRNVRLVYSSALPSHFSQFEQLLIGKYGKPQSKDESSLRGGLDKTAVWILPSTKIELIYSYMRGLGGVLNILYSDQKHIKESSDKL